MIEEEVRLVVRGEHPPISVARSTRGDGVVLRQGSSWLVLPASAVDALIETVDRVIDADPNPKPKPELGKIAKFGAATAKHPHWGS
ncbi:hypothetical protein [Williamsia sp.]|uniref:hypothetical protein n=1 Tax=Williamsia sp. TaxID=1872085 RepID=UPI002F93790F